MSTSATRFWQQVNLPRLFLLYRFTSLFNGTTSFSYRFTRRIGCIFRHFFYSTCCLLSFEFRLFHGLINLFSSLFSRAFRWLLLATSSEKNEQYNGQHSHQFRYV